MRHLASIVAAGTLILCANPIHAEVGEQLGKILPDDGAATDRFGCDVAISGNNAVVGAAYDADNGPISGSAYLVRFGSIMGPEIVKLVADDGAMNDFFGWSIAISGNTIVIGAAFDDDLGFDSGSAYLFDATTGAQVDKLLAADGASRDGFGGSVAIDGQYAVIGSRLDDDNGSDSGSAYVFNAGTGEQVVKLLAPDGATDDLFGVSVAISGNTAVVGAVHDDDNGGNSGSAYVFNATTGSLIAKLLPADGAADDRFGESVAISGTTVIVGAHHDNDNGSHTGSAYLFDATTGAQITKLVPSDGAAGDFFGFSVAISGNTVVVGAPYDSDNGASSGSAYLFDATTGAQIDKLVSDDGAMGDNLGYSVAIAGNTTVAGSWGDDDNGQDSGSAYLFGAGPDRCSPADVTTQGAPEGDPLYGVPDGQITAADIGFFVNLWILGCP